MDRFAGEAIEVSFRQLVGPLPAEDSTHSVFPYPARLLRHIPRMFLDSTAVLPEDALIIDPFCGSGTVLVEAQLAGRSSVGVDANPVAALIASVKTRPASAAAIIAAGAEHASHARRTRRFFPPPSYVDKWYSRTAYSRLSRLAALINAGDESPETNALRLALALTARETSIADPRIPVPVRKQTVSPNGRRAEVFSAFERNVANIAARVGAIRTSASPATVRAGDSRSPENWKVPGPFKNVALVTSPPYGAAQKYVRSTSLEAGWLGFVRTAGTIDLERISIGREHLHRSDRSRTVEEIHDAALSRELELIAKVNAERGAIYLNYFIDMADAFRTGLEAVPEIASIVLVAGTNVVAGLEIPTHAYLAAILAEHGFKQDLVLRDVIRGRALLTSRNGGAQPAQAEYVYVLSRDLGGK